MKSVYDGYLTVDGIEGVTYFAGANTGEGFRTSYNEIISEEGLCRVYIIKGGSGCGKSTLMKKIATTAEKHGYVTEYYLCGSDPRSLDCVLIGGRVAILDGTFPHTVDMKYPGAASEIVDLSKFWNSGALEKSRDRIIYHAAEKSAAYASAYRYLASADLVEREITSNAERVFDSAKAKKYVCRLVHRLTDNKIGGEGSSARRYSGGITLRGAYRVERERSDGELLLTVVDHMRCAPLLMRLIADEFAKVGYELVISHIPIGEHIAEIEIPQINARITAFPSESSDGIINVSRFIKKEALSEVRGKLRLAAALEAECVDAAKSRLSDAAGHHFALEDIYIPTMDFDAISRYTDLLTEDILGRLS